MELKGKLGTFPLSDVLRFIEEKGHTGYLGLHLQFEENSYPHRLLGPTLDERLMIEKGRLHGLASLKSAETWCQLLIRGGTIPKAKEKELRQKLEWVGDLMLQNLSGLLDLEGSAVRERMELFLKERVAWLFVAQDGDFWFEFEQPLPMPAGWEAVPLGELIEQGPERARMLEGLSSSCPDPSAKARVIPLGEDDAPRGVLSPGEWDTLARVNGRRTVEDLIRDSRLPVYETARHIVRLKEHLYMELVSAEKQQPSEGEEPRRDAKGSRAGRLRGMFQIGRGTDEIPEDLIGKTCFYVNRLIEHAGDSVQSPEQAWEKVLHVHPLASLLTLAQSGFDPLQFGEAVAAWGGHEEDWKDIESETREALLKLLNNYYREMVHSQGKKRADSVFRRAWQNLPASDGAVPKIEELEEALSAA
jgi:hypothetical protein